VENILAGKPPFFERAVHYEGVSQATAEKMIALSRQVALDALQSVNRDAQEGLPRDSGGSWRWNFGLYLFAEDESLKRQDPADEPDGAGEKKGDAQ
jgi:hypothetical protein